MNVIEYHSPSGSKRKMVNVPLKLVHKRHFRICLQRAIREVILLSRVWHLDVVNQGRAFNSP